MILERQETIDLAYCVDLLSHEAGKGHQAEPTGLPAKER